MSINTMTLAEVRMEMDLCTNNTQDGQLWSKELVRQHREYMAALLARKWELEGVRGHVLIS